MANFPSDTRYAWRLMERLWARLAVDAQSYGVRTFVAFPGLNGVSQCIGTAPIEAVELAFPGDLRSTLHAAGELRAFIRDNAVRTLYLTDRAYWSPAYAVLRSWGVRNIVLHDHVPGERRTPNRWRLAAKRLRHRVPGCSADLYIGVSDFVRDRFTRVAGVPVRRCVTLHNGVAAAAEQGRDIRAVFGLPAGVEVAVSCSRATYYKGIDFIIRCAARLIVEDGREQLYFVHIGDGPDLAEFRQLAARLGLSDRFIFAGQRDDVAELLGSCTLAVHASHGEAFSLAILEFMAAGLPAVVPAHCGNGEAIASGVNGVLYTPGDFQEATHWIGRILDDTELRCRLGDGARRRAVDEFSISAMEQGISELMRPFLQQTGSNA